MPRVLSSAVLSFCAALSFAQNSSWPVTPKDPRGFKFAIWNYYPQTASPTPGHTVHNLIVAFDNYSTKEVSSVDFEMTLVRDDKVVVKRSPVHVDRFVDHYFMSRHGSVPGQRAFADIPLKFDLPVDAWSPRDEVRVKILGVKYASDPQNLHNLGHFATWLKTSSDAVVEKTLKSDPALRDVVNADEYSSLAVALFFGTRRQVEAVAGPRAFGEPTFPNGMRAFHLAVRNKNLDVLDSLLATNYDPNAQSPQGVTPLTMAISNNNKSAAKWLLRHGVDTSIVDRAGWNAIRYAIRSDDSELVRLIIDYGTKLTDHTPDGYGPLHYAVAHGDEEIMKMILAAGVSVNDADPKFGITPLMAAVKTGNSFSMGWLLDHNARIDLKDKSGDDIYAYARKQGGSEAENRLRELVSKAAKTG